MGVGVWMCVCVCVCVCMCVCVCARTNPTFTLNHVERKTQQFPGFGFPVSADRVLATVDEI